MRNRVHQQIFFISCLLLVFFLPVFPRLLPAVILVMVANWLVSGIYLKTVPQIFTEKWRLFTASFVSIYLLYMVGMLYTTDYDYGWFDLEIKLSLFIFPLIFATSDLAVFTRPRVRLLFITYLSGCIAGSVILFGHSWIAFERIGVPDAFYYSNLSWYFHASYLAMYYTFGVCIVLYSITLDFSKQSRLTRIGLSVIMAYLEILIFLLSSKAGLLLLVITQSLFIILLIYKRAGLPRIIGFALLLIVLFIGFSKLFPYAFKRISKADSMISSAQPIQSNPNDGTTARMEIWKVSIPLIRQNFVFGTGTGDVKNVLLETYRTHNLFPIFMKKLNAHNQYIQTFIALGFLGFSLLVASLLIPAYRSLRKGDYLYLSFILIFAINILFESMLETQAGVVFYAFFNAFLFSKSFQTPTNF